MATSRWFRVAVEGNTIDGRKIEKQWLTDAAQYFKPETYGARVNKEHIRGATGDGPFNIVGDVIALKAEPVDIEIAGKSEQHMALFAQIEPLPELVDLIKKGQKVYTSVEIDPNFAKTKTAYLTGLAVTDSPASIGTQRLTFAAQIGDPHSYISALHETELSFDETAPTPEVKTFIESLTAFFKGNTPAPQQATTPAAANNAAADASAFAALEPVFAKMAETMTQMSATNASAIAATNATVTALDAKIAALTATLDKTEAPRTPRDRAQGAGEFNRADVI